MISLLAIAVAVFASIGGSVYTASFQPFWPYWTTGLSILVVLFLVSLFTAVAPKWTITFVAGGALIGWLLPLLVGINPF